MNSQSQEREGLKLTGGTDLTERQASIRKSRLRLLGLLFLFDVLLIAAVLLSFQQSELIEQVTQLEKTREVVVTVIVEQANITTKIITEVLPYGAIP